MARETPRALAALDELSVVEKVQLCEQLPDACSVAGSWSMQVVVQGAAVAMRWARPPGNPGSKGRVDAVPAPTSK